MSVFADLLAIAILVIIGLWIYMKRTQKSLGEIIKEIKKG